jgi:hypothetical protein
MEKLAPLLHFSFAAMLILAGCIQQIQAPNPTVYCREQGGTLEIKTSEDGGQISYCILKNGTECLALEYMDGKCKTDLCNGMSEAEAISLINNTHICSGLGNIKKRGECNEATKTWQFDAKFSGNGDFENCNPVCVVFTKNKTVDIDWGCAVANETEKETETQRALHPSTATDYNPYSQLILNKAKSILGNIRDTKYVHAKIDGAHINESIGRYYTDCSGLAGYILLNELRGHFNAINKTAGPTKRGIPYAKHYYEHFKKQPAHDAKCWQRIPLYEDIKPGDVIAYVYGDSKERKNTGHVMIAYSQLEKTEGEEEWCFLIVDSTASPHREPETRGGEGEPENGVGKGEICLGVDERGRYLRWDGHGSSKLRRLVSIGRAVECD